MANNIPGTGGEVIREIPDSYEKYLVGCMNLTAKLLIAIPEASTMEILEDTGCKWLHHTTSYKTCSIVTDRIPIINIVEFVDTDTTAKYAMMIMVTNKIDKSMLWDNTLYHRDIGILYFKIRRMILKTLRKLNAEKIKQMAD